MTSKYLRKKKIIESSFPPVEHLNRLKRVKDIHQLGFFSLDRVCIVTEEKVKFEDFIGKYLGAIKVDTGIVHKYFLNGYDYQFYQGKGKNRRLMFNPRHFDGLDCFVDFINLVTAGRKYHISQADFSYFLSKNFFSVDFLFYILWVKGSSVESVLPYANYQHALINKSKYQSFVIGHKPRRTIGYDCDSHNVDKNRDSNKMVNNAINLEISIRTKDAMEELEVVVVEDFLKGVPIEEVLNGMFFIEPMKDQFDTQVQDFFDDWEELGATRFMRQAYVESSHRNYNYIPKKNVESLGKTLKESLIELARSDFNDFINGHQRIGRNGTQSWKYLTPFLFESTVNI